MILGAEAMKRFEFPLRVQSILPPYRRTTLDARTFAFTPVPPAGSPSTIFSRLQGNLYTRAGDFRLGEFPSLNTVLSLNVMSPTRRLRDNFEKYTAVLRLEEPRCFFISPSFKYPNAKNNSWVQ